MGGAVGVAFIGCGMVSELHHLAVSTGDAAHLVGVYDTDRARAATRAREWGVRAYDTLEELLRDEVVVAVFVLSPAQHHRDHALAALQHGKHVLIEKPAGESVREILEIADAAERHGRVAMPAHNYIYQPDVWRARRLIRQGDLGRICSTWITYIIHHSEEVAAHYHGVMRQILTHHLYLLLYLLGRPVRLWAAQQSLHYERLALEDQATIVAQMEDGSVAHLFASFAADDPTSDPWTFLVKVLGTRGGLSQSWRDAVFQRPLGSLGLAIAPYEETYTYEVDHFISRCIGHREQPLSSLLDAARAQHLVELAERSIASGAAVAVDGNTRLWG
ncbi:MAG TPA: Gfo/Idh/MocA family oxidoreductase [Chloroflexota bacterium]|nr:Gfo/Idh/MocA family oxidoreductase [Chloroflexota bacterium]